MKKMNQTLSLFFSFFILFGYFEAQSGTLNINLKNKTILKNSAKINGTEVRIGDLFINTGEKANIIIAYAPQPGKRAIFDFNWLHRVSRAYQLNWRPTSRHQRVIVERDSIVITKNQIADELLSVLTDHGVTGELEIEFSNRALRLYVPAEASADIGFESLNYNQQNQRFSAMVYAPIDDPSAKRTRITGRLHVTNDIPVPNRRILRGEVIKKTDLKWIKVRARRLQTDIIVAPDDLIGKSPRRGLRGGVPVRQTAVRRPILVPKGSLVIITLNTPKMILTAQGKAVVGGSQGDIIQVKNTQSKTIVDAQVIGSGRVAVRTNTMLAMN